MNENKTINKIINRCNWADICLIHNFLKTKIINQIKKSSYGIEYSYLESMVAVTRQSLLVMEPGIDPKNPILLSELLLELSDLGEYGEHEELIELSKVCLDVESEISGVKCLTTR